LDAKKAAEKIVPFTFERFERLLFRKAGDGINVKYQFDYTIENLRIQNRIGSMSSYDLAQKSIKKFVEEGLSRKYNKLTLFEVTSDFLIKYEQYMTESEECSLTTVGIYLRSLRAIFNRAIDEKEIDKEYYPFGKRKYQIPATRNIKKALSRDQLKILWQSKPENPEQQKAKDFWFFSYACNGINIKDIALLKYQDIQDDRIIFYRAKTMITSKSNLRPIVVRIGEFANQVIEKYGNEDKDPDNFVFEIISKKSSPQQEQAQIKNFTRFINQHIKILCKKVGLSDQVSTYWARHSFATIAIREGAPMEFIQESLGHNNLNTTQKYFAGFDDEAKKNFAESLMDFN